jgi:Predicted oxidoreductases (related to aryl-alcohol dehydrogenases)
VVFENPNVSTVILGASKTEQLKDNVAALPVVEMLTPEIMELIDGVVQNRPAEPMRWADL